MVIVKISGGLGNQLFQYAFGQYIAKVLRVSVKYDLQTNLSLNNFTVRNVELMNYDFDFIVATSDDVKSLNYTYSAFYTRIKRKFAQKFPKFSNSLFVEDKLHQVFDNISLKDNCYYDGYWQSYVYLSINKDILMSQICLNKFSFGSEKLIERINSANSISLHVRRGDYISIKKNNDIFHVCSIDYYRDAIELIESKVSNPQYFIFSDDIEWAKQNFIGSEYIFVEGNNPHIDMYLMSLCENNIIANSTFSWWGAWLNSYVDKIVVAPKLWYIGNVNNKLENFIPEQWIRI